MAWDLASSVASGQQPCLGLESLLVVLKMSAFVGGGAHGEAAVGALTAGTRVSLHSGKGMDSVRHK